MRLEIALWIAFAAFVFVCGFAAGAAVSALPAPDEPDREALLAEQLLRERAQFRAERKAHRREVRGLRRGIRDKRYGPDHAVRVAAHLTGVPAAVIRRCITGESRWDPNARNPKTVQGQNARGLLQILSPSSLGVRRSTWTDQTSFGAAGWSPFDVYANVIGGAQIMAADQRRGRGYTWQWVAC